MPESILESLKWRYATKKFDNEKSLEASKIELLVQSFNLTATSYGLQPCKLIVVESKELKEKMLPISYNQSQVKDAAAVLVLCTTSVDSSYINGYFDLVSSERGTDKKVLKPFQEFLVDSFSKKSEEEIQSWAKNQAYLIMGNLLTVCAAQGIDSCPMEGFDPKAMDELLELKKHGLNSVLLLPIGYRSNTDFMSTQKKVRQPQESMVSYL
jgi:nitroreductase